MTKLIVISAVVVCLLVCYMYGADAIQCFENGQPKDGCTYCSKEVIYTGGATISTSYSCAQSCSASEPAGGLFKTGRGVYCCNNIPLCNSAGSLRTSLLAGLVLTAVALWAGRK